MSPYPRVTELVPHTAPMLSVDELLHWEPGRATTRLVIRDDDLFVVDGEVNAVCALEYMAQGVATCLGQASWVAGDNVRVGMVIACRSLRVQRPSVSVGETLFPSVRKVRGTDYLSHFEGEIHDGDDLLVASATLTLVHSDSPPE